MERIARFKKEMIDLYAEVDLRQLLEKITAGIRGYLACEEASIFIYDEEREELAFETATGAQAEERREGDHQGDARDIGYVPVFSPMTFRRICWPRPSNGPGAGWAVSLVLPK
jgi:hypothetical protein